MFSGCSGNTRSPGRNGILATADPRAHVNSPECKRTPCRNITVFFYASVQVCPRDGLKKGESEGFGSKGRSGTGRVLVGLHREPGRDTR